MLEWANVVMVVSELGERHAHSVNQVYGDNDVIKNRFLGTLGHSGYLEVSPNGKKKNVSPVSGGTREMDTLNTPRNGHR